MPKTPLILLMVVMGYVKPGSTPLQGQHGFVVRISEGQVSTERRVGPMVVGNCVVVFPNGRAHLELRRQEFAGRSMLTTYQSKLNKNELATLRQLITAEALRNLPRFVAPPAHLDSYQVSGWFDITAEIPRDASLQQIGYFEASGEKRPIGTAEMRARWSRSSAAMRSLVGWFHAFRTDKRWIQISNPKSGVCGQEE